MRSPRYALTKAKSAPRARSSTYSRPSKLRTSFPSATSVPTPVGVKKAGIPAPRARMRSANVPCGTSSMSISFSRIMRSSVSFSPT